MTTPLLQLVFPLILCFMAVVGFLVFYLESQQYTAREKVLRGVTWHSLACVIAAALLVVGQGWFGRASVEASSTVSALQKQLEGLKAEKAGLEQALVSAEVACNDAKIAAMKSEEARAKLSSQHATAVLDIAMAHREGQIITAQVEPVQAPPKVADASESTVTPSNPRKIAKLPNTLLEELQRARRSLGTSINPVYRPDVPAKRQANVLIQETLRTLGAFDGPIVGDGLVTADAVKNYQASKSLPTTGIVATRTIASIERDFKRLSRVAVNFDSFE